MMTGSRSSARAIVARPTAFAALAAMSLLMSRPADAQNIVGGLPDAPNAPTAVSTSLVLDTARTVLDGKAEPAPSAPSPVAVDRLRHLPATLSGWRINGEIGSLQWPVYLADGEVAGTRRFRLAYSSSASVLPDNSVIVLAINDVIVGRVGIAAPASVKPIDFDLPPDLLRRGFNAVKVSVEQRHRVDCSLDAAYELWTQMLPAASGFLMSGETERPPINLIDLAALRPRADGALPIDVLLEGRIKPKRVEQVLLAAQAIAITGRFQIPLVGFAPEPKPDAGVRLLVGTGSEVAALGQLPEGKSSISGPTTYLLPSRSSGPPTLVVTGATEEDIGVAIAQLAASARVEMAGTPAGIRTAQNIRGIAISGGERIRLGDLGMSSVEFSGRFFRTGIDVAMPADFLAADYAKLTIDLAGGYAAGLNSDAQVRVEVNGQNAANVALPNSSGDVFRHNEILVPLGLLQPGANRIEIVAQLSNKSDAGCEIVGAADVESKRFLLLANTEIRFPALARLGRTPDLRSTVAGGFPYAVSEAKLFVPQPDRASLSAALSVAVRMAVAAQELIPFALSSGQSVDVSASQSAFTNALIVAPARALDPKLMESIGLDPDAVREAWENRVAPKVVAVPLPSARVVLRHVQSESQDAAAASPEASASREIAVTPQASGIETALTDSSTELADQWADKVGQRSVWDRMLTAGESVTRRTSKLAAAAVTAGETRVAKADAPSKPIDARASLIVAQGHRSGGDDGVVTIVTAPESAGLLRSTELLMDPVRWSSLRGRLSVIGSEGDLVGTVEASRFRYRETQPRSFGNSRLIAAGWFSLNPTAYVVSALLLAALLASATLSLIRNAGRRSK